MANYGIEITLNPQGAVTGSRTATRSLEQLDRTATALKASIAGVVASLGVREVVDVADAWTSVSNKMTNATKASESLLDVQTRVLDVANATRTSIEATGTLYGRLEAATRSYIKSGDELGGVITTINQAMQVSGATAAEAHAALVQLSQALGAGALRGEEFNSINEQGPRIMQALADSLGVTRGQLKQMAADGKLTTQVVIGALQQQAAAIDAEFGRMTATFGSKMTVANNAAEAYIGTNKRVQSAVAVTGDYIIELANNMDTLATAAGVVGGVILGRTVGAISAQVAASLQAVTATQAQAVANLELARTAVQEAESTAAQVASERAYLTLQQQSLTSQLALAQTERTRTAIRQQLAANSNALVAAATAETVATDRLAAANVKLTAASRAASVARSALSGALGLIGGPAGLATIAAVGVYALYQNMEDGRKAAIEYGKSLNVTTDSLRSLTSAQAAAQSAQLERSIVEQTKALEGQRNAVADLQEKVAEVEEFTRNAITTRGRMADAERKLTRFRQDLAIATADLETKESELSQTKNKLYSVQQQQNGQLRDNYVIMGDVNEQTGIAAGIQRELNTILGTGNRLLQQRNEYVTSAVPTTSEEGQKQLDKLRQELELSKLTGVERAKLEAVQKLGADATAQERMEAESLAAQTYENNTSTKAYASSLKDATSAAQDNAKSVVELQQQLAQASLSGRELAVAQAKLSLNEYATPAQVANVQQLAAALFDAQQQAAAAQQISQLKEQLDQAAMSARNVAIRQAELAVGQYATPEQIQQARDLAGALYDVSQKQQLVSQVEQIRTASMSEQSQLIQQYYQQQATLREAYHAGAISSEQQYYELSAQLNQSYQDQIAKQQAEADSARYTAASQLFGGLAGITKTFAGEQSGIYKAMFAASQAFAVADAIVKIQQGIAGAAAQPFPANLAAIGSVVAATSSIVSTISGTKLNLADGGMVRGPGTGRSDSIPANLSNGEFVMPASATRRNYSVLEAMRSGATVGSSSPTVNVNNYAGAKVTASTNSRGEIDIAIEEWAAANLDDRVASHLSSPYSSSSSAVSSSYAINRSTNQ